MSEKLISADALREEMNEYILPLTENNLMGAADVFYRTVHLLEESPAVDAVEVVRCRDCKYAILLRKPEGKLIADCWIRKMNSEDEQFCMVSGDDFCSWGERREENAVD